jgi:Ser/Thr protein kinase RdoA (MazF antagonist)
VKRVIGERSAGAAEEAAREYATAVDVYERFPKRVDLAVPAPWHRQGPLLVFAFVGGHSPARVFRSAPTGSAAALARTMGEWFALLHSSSSESRGRLDFADRLTGLARRCRDQKLTARAAADGLAWLSAHLDRHPAAEVTFRRLHGDAKPDNFLVEPNRLTGFDVQGRYDNVPEHDLAQFLTQLDLASRGIWMRVDAVRRSAVETAFAEGYRRHAPLDAERLAWLRRFYLLNFWVNWRAAGPLSRWRWDGEFKHLLAVPFDPEREIVTSCETRRRD